MTGKLFLASSVLRPHNAVRPFTVHIGHTPQQRIIHSKILFMLKFRKCGLCWFRKDKVEDKERGGGVEGRGVGKGRGRRGGAEDGG